VKKWCQTQTHRDVVGLGLTPILLFLGWRLLIAWLTPIPAEDGVNYLWMAERFAAGEPRLALSEVFPPLWPLLASVPIALGIEPFTAARLVAALCGALMVVPLARVVPRGVLWLLATAPVPVLLGAECYSEPAYLLLAALALRDALRARWLGAGAWAGLAYAVRPEALVIPLACWCGDPKRAWRALVPFAAAAAALPLLRATLGLPLEASAKLTFLWGSLALHDLGRIGLNLLASPWRFVEVTTALGVLAVVGLASGRRAGVPRLAIAWVVLGVLVIVCYEAKRRFFVSLLPPVAVLAAAGLEAVPARARGALVALGVVVHLALGLRVQDRDREDERTVGSHLRAVLRPGEAVVGDMTRVLYFAGERPLPPRHFTVEELVAMASPLRVRFVVLGARRDTTPLVAEGLGAAWAPVDVPGSGERIWVLERR
jgi:hypothetical protein